MDSVSRPYDSSISPTPLDALVISLVEAGLVRVRAEPGLTMSITRTDGHGSLTISLAGNDQRAGRLSRDG